MAPTKAGADKENVHRTRIPLPKDPLPPLPKHLLAENNKIQQTQKDTQPRFALRTLNGYLSPTAGPSKVVPRLRPLKIDTRHVTLRRQSENLDWHFHIFKDQSTSDTVMSASYDESYFEEKIKLRPLVDKRKENQLDKEFAADASTPKAYLEPSRVRNIKRSLKRPHSRELVGLSPQPVAGNDARFDDKVKRRLRFTGESRVEKPDFWVKSYMSCLNRDYTSDVYQYLLSVEMKPLAVPRTSSITRACVINWLMRVNGKDGNPATIQSACWYLDSVLGTGHVQLDKLQLVAAACYWIAQKLHGSVAPALKLVKCADRAFTIGRLMEAEKIVLKRLNFPRQPVVAQDFIPFLAWVCNPEDPELVMAATFICMCGLMVDRVLCDIYPSVIAAAAVRNAVLLLKKEDLMPRLLNCFIFKAALQKGNLNLTFTILLKAVRAVSAAVYEYKAPLELYSGPPLHIAQRIISAAHEYNETVHTEKRYF